jgi:hypothetical protein
VTEEYLDFLDSMGYQVSKDWMVHLDQMDLKDYRGLLAMQGFQVLTDRRGKRDQKVHLIYLDHQHPLVNKETKEKRVNQV